MAKRKTSLAAAVHSAAHPAPAPDETVLPSDGGEPGSATSRRQRQQTQKETKTTGETRGVLIQVPFTTWKALRHLAVDEDRSLQALGLEAIEDLLRKHQSA